MARAIAPVAALASISIACLAWYNFATTGCAGVLPYVIWRDGQGIVPVFWWQPLRHAHLVYYSRETWRFFHVFERDLYDQVATGWRLRLSTLFWRLVQFPRIDIGLFLLIPMLFPPVRQFRVFISPRYSRRDLGWPCMRGRLRLRRAPRVSEFSWNFCSPESIASPFCSLLPAIGGSCTCPLLFSSSVCYSGF
jgi:hypothetical protein